MSVLCAARASHLHLSVTAKRPGSAVRLGALLSHGPPVPVPHSSRSLLDATLLSLRHPFPVSALVDSGVDENFIDAGFASQVGIHLEQLHSPLNANALDGRHLALITHRTKLLELIVSGYHHEMLQFHVILSPLSSLAQAAQSPI